MIRLTIHGAHTRLESTLCSACPHSTAGCCVGPPPLGWADVARIVAGGSRDWLLAQIAAGNLKPTPTGLVIRRVRRREGPTTPRLQKCVFHGPTGCTIAHERRPSTCNYFLCTDAFVEGGEGRGEPAARAAREAHGALAQAYDRAHRDLDARIAEAWPDGVAWDAAFLDWLGAVPGAVPAPALAPREGSGPAEG